MTDARELIRAADLSMEDLRGALDTMSADDRVAFIQSLAKRDQARLFDAAEGFSTIDLDFFVPHGRPPLSPVPHWGKNTLPVVTRFQKIFCRPSHPTSPPTIYGYNHNPRFLMALVGPGYYVAYDHPEAPGEVLIDYLKVPPERPDSWPELVVNERGLSHLVYANLKDVLRGVSSHVSIGRAFKKDKAMDAWFVLCREDR